jgi:hypothetical protein
MVELQDNEIGFAAIDARMRSQKVDYAFASSNTGPLVVEFRLRQVRSSVLFVVRAGILRDADPTVALTRASLNAAYREVRDVANDTTPGALSACRLVDHGEPAESFRQPNCRAVLRLWQFAHLTSHFSISADAAGQAR